MADIAVGIDLGTSNSCVAVARGTQIEVLPNAYGENITASVVGFRDDDTVVVGNTAKANLIHHPSTTVSSAKRLIGRYFFSEEVKKAQAICAYDIVEGPGHGVRVAVHDEEFSLPEISAMVLREMKQIAEERLGHAVPKAVVTVPAYFNDNQRQATKDAARIAGLEVLRLLNEPTAAALAYGFGRGLEQKVAVYDLGGGTFDISILEIGTDVFEVLATCGDTYLGGDDFDDRLIDLLADEFMATHGINLRSDTFAFEKLKLAAENAKRGLSVDDEVEIRIPDIAKNAAGEPITLQRMLNTQEFTSLVMDLVQRTFKVCDEALQQANLVTRDLEGIILVGGPTRLPLIRTAVAQYFGQDPKTDVDPDEVVAMGAAIHAASLVSDEPADDDAFLLDVTPLSLKIGVAGGLAETVIERNTPVPIDQTRTFTTYQDSQEAVQIKVCQGESRQADENELLGQFEFSGFPVAPRGQVRIDVTFEIDADGILNVTACEPETGSRTSTTISLSSGLSDDEMETILDGGRADRVVTAAVTDSDAQSLVPAQEAPVAPIAAVAAAAAVQPSHASLDNDLGLFDGEDDLEVDHSHSGDTGSGPPALETDTAEPVMPAAEAPAAMPPMPSPEPAPVAASPVAPAADPAPVAPAAAASVPEVAATPQAVAPAAAPVPAPAAASEIEVDVESDLIHEIEVEAEDPGQSLQPVDPELEAIVSAPPTAPPAAASASADISFEVTAPVDAPPPAPEPLAPAAAEDMPIDHDPVSEDEIELDLDLDTDPLPHAPAAQVKSGLVDGAVPPVEEVEIDLDPSEEVAIELEAPIEPAAGDDAAPALAPADAIADDEFLAVTEDDLAGIELEDASLQEGQLFEKDAVDLTDYGTDRTKK